MPSVRRLHFRTLMHLGCCTLVLSCGDPAKPPSQAAKPEGAKPVLAVTAASPSSPPTATPTAASSRRAPLSLPKAPPGIDAAQFEVLASICAVASWNGPSGIQVGCRSTPPFTTPDELPDGLIREETDFSQVCFLETFFRGSFSAPGKDEALLGLAACGNDRANDITPGNVVLAAREGAEWRVREVEPDTNLRGCVPSKGSSPTLLLCNDTMGAFGDGSLWWAFTLDFSRTSGKRENVFAKLYKTPAMTCGMGGDILAERGVATWTKSDDRIADTNNDGMDDLSFTIERASVAPSPALATKYDALCKKKKPDGSQMLEPSAFVGTPKRFTLDFKSQGRTLVPTAATKNVLDKWGDEAPEFWWKIK